MKGGQWASPKAVSELTGDTSSTVHRRFNSNNLFLSSCTDAARFCIAQAFCLAQAPGSPLAEEEEEEERSLIVDLQRHTQLAVAGTENTRGAPGGRAPCSAGHPPSAAAAGLSGNKLFSSQAEEGVALSLLTQLLFGELVGLLELFSLLGKPVILLHA
jgi:hypothetical protein